jgi:ribosomal protein S18 acetylase RimI-like enzyme
MEIREATPEDYAAAGEVAVEGYREFYKEALGAYAERLRDVEARAKAATLLVALEDGEIAGVVTYVADAASPFAQHQRDGEASIRMLAVTPRYQRRGIGRALSTECLQRAREDGKRAVVLHADEIMNASRALYESLGFVRDPSRDFRPDDETLLVCYVLELR